MESHFPSNPKWNSDTLKNIAPSPEALKLLNLKERYLIMIQLGGIETRIYDLFSLIILSKLGT